MKGSYKRPPSRRRALLIRAFVFFCTCGVLLMLAAWSSEHPMVTVQTLHVSGTKEVEAPELKDFVMRSLEGRYAYLFSRANVFLYPERTIEKKLLSTFLELKSARLSLDSLTALSLEVTERSPRYLWCGEARAPEVHIPDQCYFVDDDGWIFMNAPYFSGRVYFEMYGVPEGERLPVEEGRSEPLGRRFLSGEDFARVIRFIEGLKSLGIEPVFLIAKGEGGDQMLLENGVQIFFNRNDDPATMTNTLSNALQSEELPLVALTDINTKLQYVDLRYPKRVYYRFE
ncbi:MAG: hypothetical protein HY457_01560 [Parcubacteria group bacterium]|nr:hypothetical protein [Parcubacteria group bacterium]